MTSSTPSTDFVSQYLNGYARLIEALNRDAIAQLTGRVLGAYARGAQLFVAGNGGSAATASHLAADFSKTMLGRRIPADARRFRVISLTDNVPLITAYANDVSFDEIFAQPLRTLAQPGDVLLVISASGNSPNIVRAVNAAREMQVETLGLLGFDGGSVLSLLDSAVTVESAHYGYIEDAHGLIMHLVTDALKLALQRAEAISA
jgi:D-sedoheptulose 7-phosphate isomerase